MEGGVMTDRAIRLMRATRGLPAKVAKECGINRAAVYQWRRVPAQHAMRVARLLNLDVGRVRPDIFNPPAE
jgi:hypothetical protein